MGYAFLMRDADSDARGLLDELFRATNVAEMRQGFADLSAEMQWRREEHDRIEAEAMKRARQGGGSGRSRPKPTRRVTEARLAEAASAWDDVGGPGADPETPPL